MGLVLEMFKDKTKNHFSQRPDHIQRADRQSNPLLKRKWQLRTLVAYFLVRVKKGRLSGQGVEGLIPFEVKGGDLPQARRKAETGRAGSKSDCASWPGRGWPAE